ncbi:TetR family transcriptional regulator [Saxibacter everestensis]|uniref:TetR family transcriptional regulator n=1 Tax=Saxibacter everestensis TaxID=2909229 RepID=A0ABY8QW13_9MICO|nr:TetR family transcriptional regulator [Brevibacteriaceae bacterium ZFBP1038]
MTRLKVADRRELLIDAALRLIERKGVAAASTRAIVAEAGMSLASFHYAFESHDELMARVVIRVTASESNAARASFTPGTSLEQTLEGCLTAFLDAVVECPEREQAMIELTQHALRTAGLGQLPARQYAEYYSAAEQMLTAVASHIGCTWRLPLPELARFVIALTDGITLCWLATRNRDAAETIVRHAASAIATHATPDADPTATARDSATHTAAAHDSATNTAAVARDSATHPAAVARDSATNTDPTAAAAGGSAYAEPTRQSPS